MNDVMLHTQRSIITINSLHKINDSVIPAHHEHS